MIWMSIVDSEFYDRKLLEKNNKNLNEYLLLFEIKRALSNDTYLDNRNELENNFDMKDLNLQLGKYFNDFDYIQHGKNIGKLNYNECSLLIEALVKYKCLQSFDQSKFRKFCRLLPAFSLSILLKNKKLINLYPNIIKEMLMSNPKNAELVLDSVEKDSKILIPKTLTPQQRDKLFSAYLKDNSSNPNYLKLIYTVKFSPRVDVMVRMRAKKSYDNYIENILKSHSATEEIIRVSIVPLKDNFSEFHRNDDSEMEIKIDKNWLDETVGDKASILQNLIYVLGLVDGNFLIFVLENEEVEGGILRAIENTKNIEHMYSHSIVFDQLQSAFILKINAYYDYLVKHGVYLEEVIKWFFEEYLSNEFGARGFTFRTSKRTASYHEKNVQLTTSLQKLYKEYDMYSKYGSVDEEIVDFDDSTPRISELKGLSTPRYIYLKNKDWKEDAKILFSDQSIFGYSVFKDSKINEHLLQGIDRNKFSAFDCIYLNKLITDEVLIDNHGIINYKSIELYAILKQMFLKESINYYHVSPAVKALINMEVSRKNFEEYNFLMSKEESDYFEYYLTDYFSNGLALRNKYHHGSSDSLGEDENKHNFMTIMYLLCLLVIKINDEFDSNTE